MQLTPFHIDSTLCPSVLYLQQFNRLQGHNTALKTSSSKGADSVPGQWQYKERNGNIFVRREIGGERREKVRYRVSTAAVACSEYPGEIPEADRTGTIRDRRKTGRAHNKPSNYTSRIDAWSGDISTISASTFSSLH